MAVKSSTVLRDKLTEAQDMAFKAEMRLKLVERVAATMHWHRNDNAETSATTVSEVELLAFAIAEAKEAMSQLHTFVATEAQA